MVREISFVTELRWGPSRSPVGKIHSARKSDQATDMERGQPAARH